MMPKFALSMLVALAVCAPLQEAAAQESTLGGALFGGAAGAIVGGAIGRASCRERVLVTV